MKEPTQAMLDWAMTKAPSFETEEEAVAYARGWLDGFSDKIYSSVGIDEIYQGGGLANLVEGGEGGDESSDVPETEFEKSIYSIHEYMKAHNLDFPDAVAEMAKRKKK